MVPGIPERSSGSSWRPQDSQSLLELVHSGNCAWLGPPSRGERERKEDRGSSAPLLLLRPLLFWILLRIPRWSLTDPEKLKGGSASCPFPGEVQGSIRGDGCELQANRSKGGFMQYGYGGRTFLTFDKETLTWVAPDPQARISQKRWDALPAHNQFLKSYLEEICIDWKRKYLSSGEEMLLRTDPPVVTVSSRMEMEDGMETHVCRVDGFYPREIDASWMRDGEVRLKEDTFHGPVAPSADGTDHDWLSIRIDPKERGRYRCHVEHDGLLTGLGPPWSQRGACTGGKTLPLVPS
uniref:Ig-like domain-containing protein n=1 Tax=Laticauda laticaudata TaxID=8630 RepID=A0A8C5SYZ3_LATLA